jgi:hypothetical protein
MNFRTCVIASVFNQGERTVVSPQQLASFGLQAFIANDGSDSSSLVALHNLSDRNDWI